MNRSIAKIYCLSGLLIILWPMAGMQELVSQNEIFRLRTGLHYIYHYQNTWSYSEITYNETTSDSGIVEYTVLDSTSVNDTISQWGIVKKSRLLHTYHNNRGIDSLFWVSDSIVEVLSESILGDHELLCSSLVWNFPLTYPYSSVRANVYRYSDSVQSTLLINFIPPISCAEGHDTLLFSNDSSFQRRNRYWSVHCNISGGSGRLSARLLVPPVVSVALEQSLPLTFGLFQSYPNPFNPRTTIVYDLPEESRATLAVYDMLGRKIAVLVDEIQFAGRHEYSFEAAHFASGLYFCRLNTPGSSQVRKMILLK